MNNLLRFTLYLVVVAAIAAPTPGTTGKLAIPPHAVKSNAGVAAPDLLAIEKAFEKKRAAENIPGAALVMVKDDKVILMKGFGLRDVERKLPVTPDTLFPIGSCTKSFTALVAVIGEDEGKLSLDDSPKKYLPYFKLRDAEADSRVTIRDLLNHRTGLGTEDQRLWHDGKLNREEVIKAGMRAKPTARFREKYQYNNIMYSVVGQVIAKAYNSTWEEVTTNRIFKPLGMNSSTISLQKMQNSSDYSFGYLPTAKGVVQLNTVNLANIAPAGGINSSARDMAQWLRLMTGGGVFEGKRLVSEQRFYELVPKQVNSLPGENYRLGWGTSLYKGHRILSHIGAIDGFGAIVVFSPESKAGFAIMANIEQASLTHSIMAIMLDYLTSNPNPSKNHASDV